MRTKAFLSCASNYPTALSGNWRHGQAYSGVFMFLFMLTGIEIEKTISHISYLICICRLNIREKFEEWCLVSNGESPVAIKASLIPPKPDGLQNSVMKKASTHSVTVIASMALERRNAAHLEKQPECVSGVENLSRLREIAITRDKSKELRAVEELEEKLKLESKNRVASLPSLCDALRSKCLVANKSRTKTSVLMQHLVSELFLTKKELLSRLHILAEVVPEFLLFIPADHIVPVSTIQLNLQAPYGEVRKKIIAYQSYILEDL